MSEATLPLPMTNTASTPVKKKRVLLVDTSRVKRDLRSETMRRLGKTPEGFLLHERPAFGSVSRKILHAALNQPLLPQARASLLKNIHSAIEPFDIAGLNDPARRNWYPVLANDLLQNCARLGASEEQIMTLLARCGWDSTEG